MPDYDKPDSLEILAEKVRDSSRNRSILLLEEVWPGTEAEFIEWRQSQESTGTADIVLLREGARAILYSERHMTRAYAEAAACAACGDIRYAIAQTVRGESRTYPRPTPLALFGEAPFLLSKEILDEAVEAMLTDPDYGDIRRIQASDGSGFLFSSVHMDPAHAESLAEWMAVGHMRNP